MSRVRAADDFDAIRVRLEELRRERQQGERGEPTDQRQHEPDAVAHVPSHIVRRYIAERRRLPSR